MIQRAEIDPSGMVAMMATLDDLHGSLPRAFVYLSDHPDTGGRIAELTALSKQASYHPRPLLPDVSWEAIAR